MIRCLDNDFRHQGWVSGTVVIDKLKAGVIQADWFDPDLNPKLEEFARHYGTVILPTKRAMPRHKGKVEDGVNYAQNKAANGRTFESLAAQNAFLTEWEQNVADTRIHGTTWIRRNSNRAGLLGRRFWSQTAVRKVCGWVILDRACAPAPVCGADEFEAPPSCLHPG